MSDRYWRKIEDTENDIENAMRISSILLKLKGYDDDIEKIDTNENNIADNLEKIGNNENNISNNLEKIDNISEFILKSDKDFEKIYNIEAQRFEFNKTNHFFTIFEKEIEHDFIKNTLLFVKNNIHYKYDDLADDYHRCQHEYNIYDDKNNLIHKYLFNKDTYYNENSDILNTNEEFCIFLKQDYNKIKMVLELHRHNRHGFGNIDLGIDNGYIKIEYIEKGFLDNSHLINLNTGSISTNLGKIDANSSSILDNKDLITANTSGISSNKNLITANTSNISDNKDLIITNTSTISDIKKGVELLIEPYNETFTLSNRTITTNKQILFEKIINFDFSGLGVFNILTTCNYDKYNFTHEYHFLNNDELIFKKSIDVLSTEVKDEFKFKSIDTSSLKIILYLTDNDTNEKISLFGKNSLQFRYSKIKFKSIINENNIKTNLEKINENSGLIDTNKRDISFNSGVISNIKNNSTIIHDGVYNETFILSNRNITTQSQIIFKKIINFDFSNNGFFNISTVCNYDKKYNFNHKYRFLNNNELLKEVIIPMTSNVVKDEFKFEGIGDVSLLTIELYITDNFNNETIKLLSNSSLQFKYSKIEFKTDINENNIKSNLGKINTNTSNISSNLEKINALQTSNVKAFYNLDQIFIYDIQNGYQNVDKNNHFHIFEKEITYNFIKNSYLEIALKVLTEISNYVLIGFFQILCNFYDQDNNLFYTISLSTAMGSINKLSTIKSVFIVPINENMNKIKIDFFIAPKETQQNRSARFTIQDINSNKIYVKYFQKTDEMSIKDIQDSLDTVNSISNDLEQIDKNKNDIADNLGKINNITKTIMLKNTYFTDFDLTDKTIYKELLRLDGTSKKIVNMFNLDMEYGFKKDDVIEIDCKIILNHNSYDDAKNLALYFELYEGIKALQNKLIFRESRRYNQFPIVLNKDRIIVYTKLCYKVKYDIINIKFRIQLQSLYAKTELILNQEIIPNGSNYIFIKHYGN